MSLAEQLPDQGDEPTCAGCVFAFRPPPPHESQLECRRRAPQANKHGQRQRADWPVVLDDDWCGEFKLFE